MNLSTFPKQLIYFKLLNKLGLYKFRFSFPIYYFSNKKLRYLPIPKVACSSIKINLANHFEQDIHGFYEKNIPSCVENPQDHFIFTFVRNPFDRLVSAYKDKVVRKNKKNKHSIFSYYLGGFLMKSKNFSNFVNRISAIPEVMQEPHFASQYYIIYNRTHKNGGTKIAPNFIGKFESLENDWNFLQEKFDLSVLPHTNANKKDDWRDYYDIKTAKLVYKIYKKDFETFGYEDEYQKLIDYLKNKS